MHIPVQLGTWVLHPMGTGVFHPPGSTHCRWSCGVAMVSPNYSSSARTAWVRTAWVQGGAAWGSWGSVAVQGEQSPHEAAGTLCLLREAELGWPHRAASAITLTHPPASDTDSAGRGFCILSALQPPGWSVPAWLDAPFAASAARFRQAPASLSGMPTRCHPADVTPAGSACRAAGAHGADGSRPPWGPALAPGTGPRTAPAVPP